MHASLCNFGQRPLIRLRHAACSSRVPAFRVVRLGQKPAARFAMSCASMGLSCKSISSRLVHWASVKCAMALEFSRQLCSTSCFKAGQLPRFTSAIADDVR